MVNFLALTVYKMVRAQHTKGEDMDTREGLGLVQDLMYKKFRLARLEKGVVTTTENVYEFDKMGVDAKHIVILSNILKAGGEDNLVEFHSDDGVVLNFVNDDKGFRE